jgi:hypothetical protein
MNPADAESTMPKELPEELPEKLPKERQTGSVDSIVFC